MNQSGIEQRRATPHSSTRAIMPTRYWICSYHDLKHPLGSNYRQHRAGNNIITKLSSLPFVRRKNTQRGDVEMMDSLYLKSRVLFSCLGYGKSYPFHFQAFSSSYFYQTPPSFHLDRQNRASPPPISPISPPSECPGFPMLIVPRHILLLGILLLLIAIFQIFTCATAEIPLRSVRFPLMRKSIYQAAGYIMFNVWEGALSVLMRLLKTWLEWEGLLRRLSEPGNSFRRL